MAKYTVTLEIVVENIEADEEDQAYDKAEEELLECGLYNYIRRMDVDREYDEDEEEEEEEGDNE